MSQKNWWAKIWTLHAATGDGAYLLPPGSQFWFEPVSTDGSLSFFYLRFEKEKMDECFRNMKMYPVGVKELQKPPLPPWDAGNAPRCKQFMDQAVQVKREGRDIPLYVRLEGRFWAPTAPGEYEQEFDVKEFEIARFYHFPALECGRDWFVFDIISPGKVKVQDGTGHGDDEG